MHAAIEQRIGMVFLYMILTFLTGSEQGIFIHTSSLDIDNQASRGSFKAVINKTRDPQVLQPLSRLSRNEYSDQTSMKTLAQLSTYVSNDRPHDPTYVTITTAR